MNTIDRGIMWLQEKWHKLPAAWRYEIVSAANTFFVTFIMLAYLGLENGNEGLTLAGIISVCMVALRGATKAVLKAVTKSYRPNLEE